jgi:hypothetical protein
LLPGVAKRGFDRIEVMIASQFSGYLDHGAAVMSRPPGWVAPIRSGLCGRCQMAQDWLKLAEDAERSEQEKIKDRQ